MLWSFAVKSDWPATSSLALALRSGVGLGAGRGQRGVPVADGSPASVAGGLRVVRVADHKAAGHGFKLGRHGDILEIDARNAIELPAIVAGCGLAGRLTPVSPFGLRRRCERPRSSASPAAGPAQRRSAGWECCLENPRSTPARRDASVRSYSYATTAPGSAAGAWATLAWRST